MSHDVETPQTTQSRPSKPEPGSPPRWLPIVSLLNLAGLAAALGLAGYVLHEQHEQSKQEKPAQEAGQKADDKLKPEVAKLKGDLKDLAKSVEESPALPNYAPQIKALEDRVVDLGKSLADASDRLEALGKKLDGLSKGEGPDSSPKFEAIEKRVADLAATLDAVKAQVTARATPAAVASDEMGQAISLFKQGKYAEARDAFARLQGVAPDDARVWYFSAIANGLASRDWKGESEKLVAAGMAREKAGKPDKARIDAAFADLTTATGKDWLAFYRSRAASAPDQR
jgi:TolA-binding protein